MAQDIIDAEFVSLRPQDVPQERPSPSDRTAPDEQIGILKRTGNAGGAKRLPIGTFIVALAVIAAAFLVARVAFSSQDSSHLTAATAFEISDISDGPSAESGSVVTVSATIRNRSSQSRIVPDVMLTFVSSSGEGNLVYRVPRGEMLKPGKSLAFTVRMPKKAGYGAPRLGFSIHGA